MYANDIICHNGGDKVFHSKGCILTLHIIKDAKVVTIFNMIAVPCFVYQGAVGLLGERLEHLVEE